MLLERQQVCDRLSLSRWQSYQMFPVTRTGLIREADILQFVNIARRGSIPAFSHVPELVRAEALEEETGAPAVKVKRWARRKRNPIPHVHFNSHVLRFPKEEARAWLEEHSR